VSAAKYYNPKLRRRILSGREPCWLAGHPRRSYIVAAVVQSPEWVDRGELQAFYAEARRLTETTGVRHVVDHDVPLNHPFVCGLHVPWNLRVVPWRVNATKGNRFNPDQMEIPL
jgi:hypothetical protein